MKKAGDLIEYHILIDVSEMKGTEIETLQQNLKNDVNFYDAVRGKNVNTLIVRVFVDKSQDTGEVKDKLKDDLKVIYCVNKEDVNFISTTENKGLFQKVLGKDVIAKYYVNLVGNLHYNEKDEQSQKSIKKTLLKLNWSKISEVEKEILIPQVVDDYDIKKTIIDNNIDINKYTNKLGHGTKDKLTILKSYCHCIDGSKFSRDVETLFSIWKSVQMVAIHFDIKYDPMLQHVVVLKEGVPYSYSDFESQCLSLSLSQVNQALEILKLVKGVRVYFIDEIIEHYCTKPNPTIDGINKLQDLYGFDDKPEYRNKDNFIWTHIDYMRCQLSGKESEPTKQHKPYVTTVFAGGSGTGKTSLMNQLYDHPFLFDKYLVKSLVSPSKNNFANDGNADANLAYGTLARLGGFTHGFDDIKTDKAQEIADKAQSSAHQRGRGMKSQAAFTIHFQHNKVTTSNDPYNYIHDIMGNDRRLNIHVATKRVKPSQLTEELKIEIFSYIYDQLKNNKEYQDSQLENLEICRMKNNSENHAPVYIKMCDFLSNFDNDYEEKQPEKQLNIEGIKEVLGLPKDFKNTFDELLTLTINTNKVKKIFKNNTAYYSLMKKPITDNTRLI